MNHTLRVIQTLTATDMTIGERASYSLRMLIVGLGMVFFVLTILWGVLVLFRIFLHDLPEKKKARAEALSDAVAKTAEPLAEMNTQTSDHTQLTGATDDGALIAAITAAVTASMDADGTYPAGGFRVVSFRRASAPSSWNRR